jgi:hypothetical protein
MLSQKEAVYRATISVLRHHNIPFQDGDDIKTVLGEKSYQLRHEIRDLVFDALMSGMVRLADNKVSNLDKLEDQRTMKHYATSLVVNWLRKDWRFNSEQPKELVQRFNPSAFKEMLRRRSRAI